MPEFQVGQLIIYIVVLLLAISAHEAAHAWMSYRFGDDTAYLLGRVTLNPVAHTDPIGTLLIPIISFIAASTGTVIPLIGWGKPTPVNPLRWRNKDTANVMVSLAGIMANTAIAIVALLIIKTLQATGLFSSGAQLLETGSLVMGTMSESYAEPVALLLYMTLVMNASLAVFNLMPFPPLDGSKVLETFLPASMQPMLTALEQYGYLILMAAVYFGLFRLIFGPVNHLISFLLLL
ncbi:MAG TPA: site-2 protease family protein [Pyrinomonadaceae bacterium]|jgi:Zn-dependent protease|nr:site-2 protease family protein [Pyrinomonadaceae bacterium]